MEVILVILRS